MDTAFAQSASKDNKAAASAAILVLGSLPEAMGKFKLSERLPDPKSPEFQSYLDLVIRQEQIDEVLEYQKSPDTSPEMQKRVADFLSKFDHDNAFPHDHPEMRKHIEFVHWTKLGGADLSKTRLVLYAKDYRGLHATVDIQEGEEVIAVPMELTINGAKVQETVWGKRLAGLIGDAWKTTVFPVIEILEEIRRSNSEIKKWLDVLPSSFGENPAFFTAEEQGWLEGSDMEKEQEGCKGMVKWIYEKIGQANPDFCAKHTFAEFLEMYYIMCSRYFFFPECDPNWCYTVPYADMTNCTVPSNAKWRFDKKGNRFTFVATRLIRAGEAIALCYGHFSNFALMSHYAMAIDDELYDSVAFVLDFARVPHGLEKLALLRPDPLDKSSTKLVKFRADFEDWDEYNLRFMSHMRYYLFSGPVARLQDYVKAVEECNTTKHRPAFPPETADYEVLVLSRLSELVHTRLLRYPSKLEDDLVLMNEKGLSYKRVCALRLIVGEKKSLKVLAEMVEYALGLLKLPSKEEARKQYEALTPKPVYAPYIEKDLFRMVWK